MMSRDCSLASDLVKAFSITHPSVLMHGFHACHAIHNSDMTAIQPSFHAFDMIAEPAIVFLGFSIQIMFSLKLTSVVISYRSSISEDSVNCNV